MEWFNITQTLTNVSTTVNGIFIDNGIICRKEREIYISFEKYYFNILLKSIEKIYYFHYPGCELTFNILSIWPKDKSRNYVFTIKNDISALIKSLTNYVALIDCNGQQFQPISLQIRGEMQLAFVSGKVFILPFYTKVMTLTSDDTYALFESFYENESIVRFTICSHNFRLLPFSICVKHKETIKLFQMLQWKVFQIPRNDDFDSILYTCRSRGQDFYRILVNGKKLPKAPKAPKATKKGFDFTVTK